jgi:hypothetical protein
VCDDATAVDIEVNPQRRRFGRSESDFALQALIECPAQLEKEGAEICRACVWRCCVLFPITIDLALRIN